MRFSAHRLRSEFPPSVSLRALSRGPHSLCDVYAVLLSVVAIDLCALARAWAHEPAVRDARFARRGVDARDPERAELTLLLAAVAVGVVQRVERRLAGGADELVLCPAASFGGAQELLVLLVGCDPALYPCHAFSLLPYEVRQHLADQPEVASRHECLARVSPLPARRL